MQYPVALSGTLILTFFLPVAALANLTGTQTLNANTALSLDTGATSSSGGDILWSGTAITPQTKAGAFNLGSVGAAAFSGLSQSTLQFLTYSSSPIPAATLVVNDVFAVKTNGGNYAAVLVTAASGTSITLQFTTFGVSGAPSGPTITQVINNFSFIPAGFSNSGIAPGSLFVIIGSGLAPASAQALPLQSSSGSGLPTTLNGASVKVTVNGTSVTPAFYYAIATALALVLPSNTPLGTGTVTVTYNNQTSSPYTIQVTQSGMGFDTYYGTGSGLGVATNPLTGALYSYNNSIPPGTIVTLWGSGLGADPARDTTYTPAAFAINNLAHIYVGGIDATISYQGASGFPGVNQVNITIPANAPTGCNVPMVGVTSGGVPTNFTTLPIGSGPCSDPAFGTSGTQFQSLSGQSTVKTGIIGLYHSISPATSGSGTQTTDFGYASFQSTTGASYGSGGGLVSVGGCILSETASSGSSGTTTGLDAGSITVTNPAGTAATLMTSPLGAGSYYAQLASGFIPSTGGMFAFHGAGGANVGSFNTSVVYPSPGLSWTNQSAAAAIARANGLQVAWTGGASGTYVTISGSSSTSSAFGSFTCIAPVSAGQFTVPPYVLGGMPAGSGSVTVSNQTAYTPFSASGIDAGFAIGFVSTQVNSTFN
jgi:uncharacterized protein (TIGR03437 family)